MEVQEKHCYNQEAGNQKRSEGGQGPRCFWSQSTEGPVPWDSPVWDAHWD